MKVPPLIINLKDIEKREKHKKHKKHKKHHKHHHKHHHHEQTEIPNILPAAFTQKDHPPILDRIEVNEEQEYDEFEPQQLVDDTPVQTVETNAVDVDNDNIEAANEIESEKKAPDEEQETNDDGAPKLEEKPPTTDNQNNATISEHTSMSPNKRGGTPTSPDIEMTDVERPPQLAPKLAKLTSLRMTDDGEVTLSILGTIPKPEPDSNQKIINIEKLCGQLENGIEALPSEIVEDTDSKVKPIDVIETDPFSSFLPVQDSTFANISKEESSALLEIYGENQTCYEYAESIQNFANGSSYVMDMVDEKLSEATLGKHDEAVEIRKRIQAEKDELQKQLDGIDDSLKQLRKIQEARLSSSPLPIDPSEEETQLAEKILEDMTKLIKEKAKPGEICSSEAIFKALSL